MWSWRRRDTSEAIHRILIDATLKAFRARIHGNLRNPISQLLLLLLLLLLRSAKTEFYPHPRVVNWKSFARFLFARIWLWKLDSGQILFEKPRQKFCQAKLCIPGKQWERRSGDQTQSFISNTIQTLLSRMAFSNVHFWLKTPPPALTTLFVYGS